LSKDAKRGASATGLLIAFAASVVALSGPAEAQPFQRQPYEEWQYETKRPQRGYEGFPAPGIYCSYRRIPNRVCTVDKRGREVCRVKSWTIQQSCG
jgi:hypothetical protein